MSRFHRSGHTRTNSHGTTFWVRDHDVSRDELQQSAVRQQTMYSNLGISYGITYPNARCPVCGDSVFYFQAYNGGRVFFDPPLGPPWDKHPCTTREPERANEVIVDAAPNNFTYDATKNPESYSFSILPRMKHTVVEIYGDDEEDVFTYATTLQLNHKYLDRIWPTKDDTGNITGFSFLTVDFEPVEVRARQRRPASSMDDRTRRELSRRSSKKLNAVARRINGVIGEVELYESRYGTFGIVNSEVGNVILVPVTVDHKEPDLDEIEHTIDYMSRVAQAALNHLQPMAKTRHEDPCFDPILFVFDDAIGHLYGVVTDYLGFRSDGLYGFYDHWSYGNPLRSIRGRMMWVDSLDDKTIILPDCSLSLKEALEVEEDYCAKIWPEGDAGRWSKIRQMIDGLGLDSRYAQIHEALKGIGWRINHTNMDYETFTHEIEYVPPDRDPHDEITPRARILFSQSSKENGLCVVAGIFQDNTLFKGISIRIGDAQEIADFSVKLRDMTAPTEEELLKDKGQ